MNEIGIECGTDKATLHKYTTWYPTYFEPIRHNPVNLLEIGVYAGASLKMWSDYFDHPETQITGVDIHDAIRFSTKKIKTLIADQASREQLARVLGDNKYDIIVDDGGHMMNQQLISWGFLFKYLKPNGFYVLEDICTAQPELYPAYCRDFADHNNSLAEYSNLLIDKQLHNDLMLPEEKAYIIENVGLIDIFKANPRGNDKWISMTAIFQHKIK
jgi:hypothetical protein